jgi:acyl-CoA thioester hydrolase
VFHPGHETDRKPPFRFAACTRVAFSDTDAQGVVYYGRYLPYFDLARTEYHRRLGQVHAGTQSAMRALTVEYHAPARFDDLIEIFVRVAKIGRTSMTYEFAAYKLEPEESLMVTATQTNVFISPDERRPVPVPDDLRAALSAAEGVEL